MRNKRERWSSNFGFLMAAAGSAIGLGNIWKFPYLAGSNGGAVFLIFYFIIILFIGAPILLAEMSVGRATHLNSIDACRKINPNWGFVGLIGFWASFFIMSYYCVIGGWVTKYIFKYVISERISEPAEYFTNFSSSSVEPIIWLFIFLAVTALIVTKGISKGIELASKIFLPLLFVLIIIIAIYSLSLPGSSQGLKFFFVPDYSKINSAGDLGTIFLNAMGQVFFSLSLGMGTLITYGSYVDRSTNLTKNALYIPILDSLFAILAGVAILPAVFAYNLKPDVGPGLLFQVMPIVFSNMQYGKIIGIMFFVLVFFAAITSSISLLEVITSYLIDSKKMKRSKAALLASFFIFVLGSFVSLSFGALGKYKIADMNLFDFLTSLTDKILMPIGGFLMCILVGYVWGIQKLTAEISSNGMYKVKIARILGFILKFLAPAMILLIFISSIIK